MKTVSPLTVAVLALAIIGTGFGVLKRAKARQHSGIPGVRVGPVPTFGKDDKLIRTNSVVLPDSAPGFVGRTGKIDLVESRFLPPDTTFGRMLYESSDGASPLTVQASVILMGADRTSIHQPEYCLTGNGWRIKSRVTRSIPFPGIEGGELHVRRFDSRSRYRADDGSIHELACIYVFWFVADDQITPSHWVRTLWMTRDLLTENVLQRWAYISYFATCQPGEEDVTFERVCELIRATVPKFQISGFAPNAQASAR